jgi:tetratricopeptide (TPR) repeat protein
MTNTELHSAILDPNEYTFWRAPRERTLNVGPEQTEVPLPEAPLPLKQRDLAAGEPDYDAIGSGLYDYLKQFPDCPHNTVYAELLRDAYPQNISDLGAQIMMLEHKEVDAPYIRRKISYMKILLLLDPENIGLLQRLGMSCYELALIFSELHDSRRNLLAALGYLQRLESITAPGPQPLNLLGQINFMIGDFPVAARYWRILTEQLPESAGREELTERIRRLENGPMPEEPLIAELETIAEAAQLYTQREYDEALIRLEVVEESGSLPRDLPMAPFYYLLALCRDRTGDHGGAFDALEKALNIEPDFAPALQAHERFLERGSLDE